MTTLTPIPPAAVSSAAGAPSLATVSPVAAGTAPVDSALTAALQALADALNATNLAGIALSDAVAVALLPPPAPAAPVPVVNPRYQLVAPWEPLAPVLPDNTDKWYAITRGKYVGLTRNSAVSLAAVSGVSQGLHNHYSSQTDALNAFNEALATFAVEVIL
ncbi:hypothetical protein C8J57DRAFT_1226283 [Mycena rebaudengoi]|nr:hypothetical protein C8J57DRAFT_1226283 [Mycena rebaudengoi]